MSSFSLRSVYPDYAPGELINPQILLEGLIVAQNQESVLAKEWLASFSEVDKWKYRVKKEETKIEEMLSEEMVSLIKGDKVPKEFTKNIDLVKAYIKSELGERYKAALAKLNLARKNLAEAQTIKAKYELALGTIENMVNAATQVLSYAKHQENMERG